MKNRAARERRWTGQVAVVVGSAGGIGAELVRALREKGADVRCFDLDSGVDVRDRESVRAAFARVGPIDAVFYAAGIATSGRLTTDLEESEIREAFEINVLGLVEVASAAAEGLRRSRGRLVTLNSAFSLVTAPGYGAYSASKAALARVADALRPELAPATVTDCLLGGVRTEIFRASAERRPSAARREVAERFERRIARRDADDVAEDILRAALARRPRPPIGTDARLLSLAHRLAPAAVQSVLHRAIGPYPERRPDTGSPTRGSE